uniref:BAG domain-containing protein n=1 Tax=Meloidogyne incognita TaxID=6306 RepID=A0A914L3C8_MELIC
MARNASVLLRRKSSANILNKFKAFARKRYISFINYNSIVRMERSDVNRPAGRGLPRRSFTDDFFNDPFDNFNPISHPRGFQRRFTERGLFDDDVDTFFDRFSGEREHQIPFRDEPSLFRSSMPRRHYKPQTDFHGKNEHSSVERPITIQLKKASSSQPKCSSSILKEDDEILENVHRIPIRQMTSGDNQKEQNLEPKNASVKSEHNILPNETRIGLNPADKRRRFSNCQQQNEHNYANSKNQFKSVPDIVIDDYSDRSELTKPVAIPLPAPAIPLPAPQHNAKLENEKNPDLENLKRSEVNVSENEYTTVGQYNADCKNGEAETSNIHIVPLADSGEHLIQLLDDTERKVEKLRENATSLEQEKEAILDMLKNIKLTSSLLKLNHGDRDELALNADRIINRCRSVEVCVNTPRDEHQDQALKRVNEVIYIALNKTDDRLKTQAEIQGFLNACMPEESGHIDNKFQSLIIACTADDQKKIRRRLVKIMEEFEQTQPLPQTDLIE